MNILRSTADLEKLADEALHRFAVMNSAARRDAAELDDVETYRTRFKRDRDRILYTKAFRRMQSKTQVLASNAGDHYRTRLTHSLEVQQLAGSMADALGLNRDLAEAIAIGHDLGHSPFGHAAERELNRLLKDYGGFSHAVQSVRCIEHLETRLHARGLNLCVQVREGILKHDADVAEIERTGEYKNQWHCNGLAIGEHGSLESQLVYWADKIAYLSHDWEDFERSGIMAEAIREKILDRDAANVVWAEVVGGDPKEGFPLRDMVREIKRRLLANTEQNLYTLQPTDASHAVELTQGRYSKLKSESDHREKQLDIKKLYRQAMLVGMDEHYAAKVDNLRRFLNENFIKSPNVARMDALAVQIVRRIFEAYANEPSLMPLKTRKTLEDANGDIRVIADHISCMTDRYATEVYKGLFMP